LINTNKVVPLKDSSIVGFAYLPSLHHCLIVVFLMANHTDWEKYQWVLNLQGYPVGCRSEQRLFGLGDFLRNKSIQISDSMHNFHGFADFRA